MKCLSDNGENQIHAISLLRGVSSIYVMLAHILIWGAYSGYFPNPKVAVDIFIFISGFLIYSRLSESDSDVTCFYISRFLRIAPSYYFTIVVFALLYPLVKEGLVHIQSLDPIKWPIGGTFDANNIKYDIKSIMIHMTFIFGFFPLYSQSSYIGDWSIGLEMQFYILAPIIFIFFKKSFWFVLIVVLAILSAMYADHMQPVWLYREPSLILFKIHLFILGALTFSFIKEKKNIDKVVMVLAISSIICLQFWLQHGTYLSNNSSCYLLLCVLLVINFEKVNGLLNYKIISFFSNISYPLFLIHGFFIAISGLAHKLFFIDQSLLLVMATITLPCSVFCAWGMSVTVERMGTDSAKKITRSLRGSKGYLARR